MSHYEESLAKIKLGLIALAGLVIWGFSPSVALAEKVHTGSCNECHRSAANPRALANLCVNCHTKSAITTNARFDVGTASNTLAHNPTPGSGSGAETSHFWGGNPTLLAAAGSANPPKTFYASRYSISTNRTTCTICHDPHGQTGTKLVRAATAGDLICQQCHGSWFISNDPDTNALLTHPIIADYAAIVAAKPKDYKATVSNVGNGDVRLVNGGVSCTSCHGTHYADSSSATVDGTTTYNDLTMAAGDGNILRADGPLRTGSTRNGATGTAQLRSNLCQSCHAIELHGQGASGDHMIGCLDCHGGHAYNGGTPNAYILNKKTPDAVPTRINGVNSAAQVITFANYASGGSSRTKWADDVAGTANGLCEKCHGDVNGGDLVGKAAEHEAGNTNECTSCHKHNDPADLYSFNRDASAATCGQCHGFPPYKNVPGDRVAVPANDGGYAENNSGDANTPYDYVTSTTYEKDETKTGHKVHAGRDLPTSPDNALGTDWYFVGSAGIDNCKVCHGPNAGSAAGGHREAPATRPDTFRDVPFDGIAKTGSMSPAYNINSPWTCTNVYCHTNGAPYGASRPTRVYTFVNTTPPWVGAGTDYATGGYGSIHGKTYECASCHGNDATSMGTGTGAKQNSTAHLAHLGDATTLNMGKIFSCKVCHVKTAASSTVLTVDAMDGRVGGEHVNGLIDVDFETGTTPDTLPEALTGSTYAAGTGVCSTYCHNVTGAAGAVVADWDLAATDMQCDSCHGGLATDASGDGGFGAISTGSHTRHILTTGTGPKLLCAECHGTGSDAGTHAGHFDGFINMKPPVDGVAFADVCRECHGYDGEAGEVLPVWGSPATTDCATCHAGIKKGANINGKAPLAFVPARSTGHNRPTSAGAYPQTANPAANVNCTGCHVSTDSGHWDGVSRDDKMLIAGSGFPATYAGNENNFCNNCHGASGTAVKKNINTHQSKLCIACHNVHGDQNIQMIWTARADQLSHDSSTTGKYAGDVVFTNVTNFAAGNTNSYDEDDGAVGAAGEVNSDDVCATCHTSTAGTTHNNSDNTDNQASAGHQIGTNCFTCHAAHTDSTDAFKVGAGTACNDCHGFPPNTAAHNKHSKSASNDKDIEDRTDCAWCHTGADLYTYDLALDQAAAGDRNNHGKGQANRRTVLGTSVGYETTNFSCATACHASSATDGAWNDTALNCNACHYAAASPTSGGNVTANNSEAISASHNKHFDKSKGCAECHDVTYSTTIVAVAGPLAHISDQSGANEGLQYQGMATALADEAAVVRAGMTFDDPNNTCSGGIGIGCHASGIPDWDIAIPVTSAGCVECHTNTNDTAYNPTSGLHDNSPSGPTVTGNAHDGSFNNGSGGTADCVTCHTTAPTAVAANHINGTLNTGAAITVAGAVGYTVATADCATACHSAGAAWRYKWSTTAYATNGNECANCHGMWGAWNAGVGHAANAARGNSSNHDSTGNLSYACTACHVIGATTNNYKWASKWDPTGTNSSHGDGALQMNNNTAVHTRSGGFAGCTGCHGAVDGSHDFPQSTLTPVNLAGDAPAAGGGCDGCHGGGGSFAPNGSRGNAWPDRPGKHSQHMAALTAKGITGTAACNYCHPYSSGNSYVVGEHNDAAAPATMPNATSTYYKRIIGEANDSNGITNGAGTNYVTCSNIDCHFDMPRTPHWYTDDIAPAAVTLTAAAGPKPRTIKVTWNAPGDDDNVADTTPYVYDLRIGTTAAIATDFARTDNYAGNLPAAYKQGFASEAIVENLNVGTTYYFSLKTRDTAGNWSPASAAVSALPTSDTTAPFFGGANKATKGDSSATVYLEWTPAEDHTMPITYKVWRKAASAGALNMDADTPLLTGVKGHSIQLTSADPDLLVNDTIYNFGVRACDANNNCDTNKQIVSATPTAAPQVTKTNHTYRTNGNRTLVKDGAAGTAVTGAALPLVFTPSANNTYSVAYYVDTFAVYLDITASNAATIRATIGYSTDGSNFTSLGVSKDVAAAKAGDRVYSFKLVDVAGKTIPSGQRLAIQLSEVTSTGVKVNYGSTAYRGDVTLAEQIVNVVPTDPAVNATVSGATVNVTWTASTDTVDGLSDTVHYDLFGSDDNGATYRYLIARDIPAATTSYAWNTQEDGISGAATVAVKLLPGDGYGHYTDATTTKIGLAIDNSADKVAPSAINDLTAKARPKSGSVWLTWTAPGDDEHNNGRAKYYDIRYSTAAITEGNFASASQCVNEPSPDFGGKIQNFEVTGLTPGQNYYFAIKTYDEGGNASAISTAKAAGSDQAVGGPRCGMCHTTAPSIVESVGNHKLHGFTINDCTKCHGSVVASYGLDHQDGLLKMGYGPGGPQQGIISGNRIYYTNDGTTTGTVMYDDTDGFGGFGNGDYVSVGDFIDDGTCMNFGAMGVGGCHSSAGTDPDGAGALPTYPTPTWDAAATLSCSACHGNPSRTTDSFYNRAFDATTANAGVVPDQIKGAPVVDNRGNYDLADPDEKDRKYIGQHEKHLNYSFRFSKGDSCNLCHSGNYRDVNDLDGKHANGEVDVKLDLTAAGAKAAWTAGTATTAGSCSNMSPESCHPSASSPKWDSAQNFDCVGCHGMGGTTPSHVTDPNKNIDLADNDPDTGDAMKGNCTWCHFGGHPLDDVGGTALILANSSQVGINYRSGGIHLKKSIGGRVAQATEAELCWQCHDANGISEWGTDTGSNNTSTKPANASDYNYGTVTTSNWTTASWSSSVANFSYKTGNIQSTHSTSESGTSAVTGTGIGTYKEAPDAVGKIRCSNCHDVHNLNKAPGDSMTGQPYLRGTWIRNPYPEDGAPWNKAYAVVVTNYGAVPRAGGNEQGGYQIDQNNSFPTAGLSLATSAGLCTLCHGTTVDSMDKTTGESLWIGTNGHSNSALGGTASNAENIFGNGIGGRPAPVRGANSTLSANDVFTMGLQNIKQRVDDATGDDYGYGYRGQVSGPKYTPILPQRARSYKDFTWGVAVDANTIDIGYHAFTCSKCHNPHASRLPKLMITNCLDTRQNTWDNGQGKTQTYWNSTGNPDLNEWTATHNTAQNCHRYDPVSGVGGWNKVTPWQ
jgi:predicted CXXCH cytochrome family protein